MTGRSLRAANPPLAEPSAWHSINLTVNGAPVEAEVESRLLLTDFVRHRLRLTGTHVGCEQGSCGACTVLLDGSPIRSCLTLAVQTNGRELRTIEDLATPEQPLTELQQAFHDQHGLQCGFCTPGFLMSLTPLAEGTDAPTAAEIDEALGGNYCRCTGYVNIRRAANQAFGLPDPGDLEATEGPSHDD